MSRYIGSSPNGRLYVRFEELVSKAENPGGFLRKNVFRKDDDGDGYVCGGSKKRGQRPAAAAAGVSPKCN